MATEFKYLKFGLVPANFDNGILENNERIINSFLKGWGSYQLLGDAQAHAEIFDITRRYIGANFRNWLIVNFRNGGGARKELARKIVGYIAGRFSGTVVINQLNIDFNRIQNMSVKGEPIPTSLIYNAHQDTVSYQVEDVDFSVVEDRHFYDFMALIGPELAAKFCLSMDGIYYYDK
jgi:hypothetical protein